MLTNHTKIYKTRQLLQMWSSHLLNLDLVEHLTTYKTQVSEVNIQQQSFCSDCHHVKKKQNILRYEPSSYVAVYANSEECHFQKWGILSLKIHGEYGSSTIFPLHYWIIFYHL